MRKASKFANSETLMKALSAGAVLLWGCADLALEDRIPSRLGLVPDSAVFGQGESAKLEVVAWDQDDEPMPVPSWARPVWSVSDESIATIGPDGTLTGLKSGQVGVSARMADLRALVPVRFNPDRLRLTAPVIYVTQAAQDRHSNVQLIAGRSALLRVFAVGDVVSYFDAGVRVTLLQGDQVVFEGLGLPPPDGIPTRVDESNLRKSMNVAIPGSAIQPGVRMVVEIDPEGVVPLLPESRTRYPETGSTELNVVAPQLFRQVFVPSISIDNPDMSVYDWLDGIGPRTEQTYRARNMLPIAEMEVEVHDALNTRSVDGSWSAWINEIRLLNIREGRRGYYYGVAASETYGVRGLGSFANPWSVGTDIDFVYTHEVGHNMDLRHAPCGGAGGPDPSYPHENGSIGIWGYDVERNVIYNPARYRDVMSYCFDWIWISDYQFRRAANHRVHHDGGVDLDGGAAASGAPGRGEMLVVWGLVQDGDLRLDPAFVLEGPAELPERPGPYRVEGLGAGGEVRFSLSFTPAPLEFGGASFAYLVPYEPEWATTLDRMVLTGPEGEYTMTRDGEPEMAVLTDPSTGVIRTIARNWDGGPLPGEETADVTLTRGIPRGRLR